MYIYLKIYLCMNNIYIYIIIPGGPDLLTSKGKQTQQHLFLTGSVTVSEAQFAVITGARGPGC